MRPHRPMLAAGLLLAAGLAAPAAATAAVDTADTTVAVDGATVQMRVTADCALAEGRCHFSTHPALLTADGPTGFPDGTWARQTVTVRSNSRDVWQETQYSAPAGAPPQTKGANIDGVLSKMFKALNNAEISVTYFSGGAAERFSVEGTSVPTDWTDGRLNTTAQFIVCASIQVVYGAVNAATPTACAQTTFS